MECTIILNLSFCNQQCHHQISELRRRRRCRLRRRRRSRSRLCLRRRCRLRRRYQDTFAILVLNIDVVDAAVVVMPAKVMEHHSISHSPSLLVGIIAVTTLLAAAVVLLVVHKRCKTVRFGKTGLTKANSYKSSPTGTKQPGYKCYYYYYYYYIYI